MAFHNHGSDAITGTVYSIVHVFNECSIALYDGRDRAELQLTVVINIIYKQVCGYAVMLKEEVQVSA